MRTISIVLTAALLSGCATRSWVREGGTANDLARDSAQCEYEAEAATANNPNAMQSGWNAGVLKVRCMQARGWHVQ